MEKEIWKPIDGTFGRYEISNLGKVKKDGIEYKVGENPAGYKQISIGFIFGRRVIELHRLVAAYFCNIPFSYDGLQVNHIDGNKANNTASNLEWCTAKQNQQHRIHVLGKNMKGENNPMFGKSGEFSPVFKGYILQIDKDGNVVGKYAGSGKAAKAVEGRACNVLRAIKTNKTYHGYIWKREQDFCLSGFKTS